MLKWSNFSKESAPVLDKIAHAGLAVCGLALGSDATAKITGFDISILQYIPDSWVKGIVAASLIFTFIVKFTAKPTTNV